MGALGWEIMRSDSLVIVRGVGIFDLPFIFAYRHAMETQGAVSYRKLFDLHQSDILLSAEDLQSIADGAHTHASTAGPVAIVIGREPPPMLVDMAILLKHRMGASRRFRLFTEEAEARQWLASEPISPPVARIPPKMLPVAKR